MRVITVFFIVLFLSSSAFSQEKVKKIPKHKTVLSIGLTASPDIYIYDFKYNFSAKFGLGFDPYFRYYLNRIDKTSMSANPVSFGGKVSLYINFIHKHHRGMWGK